ncbi:MAG: spore germination protein [Ruminococcaceae bacterium]|nr:spore germination protein [Oscillospiraceae bacterium]
MKIYDQKLTADYLENLSLIEGIIRPEESFDIIKKKLVVGEAELTMFYIDGFIKSDSLEKLLTYIVTLKDFGSNKQGDAQSFANKHITSAEVDVTDSVDQLVLMLMSGCTVMLCNKFDSNAIIIDYRTYPARSTDEPENDKVMRGSRDGFVETLISNTAMIRRRIRSPRLTVKYLNAGKSTRTDLAICYMDGRADREYVDSLIEKISSLKTDSLVLGHQSLTEALIKRGWYNPFPKIRSTERPDAAAATILEGGVIVLCDNSPEAMIFPTTLFDFLQETDDFYFPPLTGSYLRVLRQAIFWMTVFITPLWYLVLEHEYILPDALKFLIPKDPGELPIFLQLIMVELALDGLKLASLNTPSVLSNSLSVVGGLLLGDFAVTVGWLCPDVILYMSFIAIANFTQSNYELGYAFKYMRVITLVLTVLFDWWGFTAGVIITVTLAAINKTVDGKRKYLYPLIPWNGKAMARLIFRLKKRY